MSASDQEGDLPANGGVTPSATGRSTDGGGAAAGREWEFTQLWTSAQPTVASYVRAVLGDRAAVDDVVQEVAMAVYAAFEVYDPSRPFIAWALGIARNKARDRLRVLARSRQVGLDVETIEAMAEIAEELDDEMERRRVALQRCLGAVEGRADELLRLHYHEGHEPHRIAEMLGLQAGHVRVLLNRVRAALRQCIERSLKRQPQ